MSTNRHIDKICIIAAGLALLLTLLFINGRRLGITPAGDGDAGEGQFTANDRDGDWDSAGATRITLAGGGAEIDGKGAYAYDGGVRIVCAGKYVLSGELTDGSVVVDAGGGKLWLLLDGASIHCEDGAALLVEQAEKVFLTLAEGKENAVSSGAEYEDASSGVDGAIYSRDDLTINGGGSLAVTAGYRHGIVCNDDFVMAGGTVAVTAVQDGIHANDSARFTGMDLTVSAGDDGITVSNDAGTGYFYMESGSITIPSCYEGIEAVDVTVAGGVLDLSPTDDGINADGGGESAIRITGGQISIVNETGRDADGLDSNGSIDISGGSTFISVSSAGGNCALDAGSENGGVCRISGGTVIAAGGSAMAQGFDQSSPQGFVMCGASGGAGTAVTLKDGDGAVLLAEELPCAFTSLILSTPGLKTGDACTLSVDGSETGLTVGGASSGGFGGTGTPGGMPGEMAGGPGGRGGPPDGGFGEGGGEGGSTPPGGFATPESGGEQPDESALRPAAAGGPEGTDGAQADGRMDGPGERPGGGPFAQRGQEQAGDFGGEAGETSALSPDALALVGACALLLAVGILIALKTKH